LFTFDVQPPEPRSCMLTARLTSAERDRLKRAAEKRGLKMGTVMRELSLAWAENVLGEDGE